MKLDEKVSLKEILKKMLHKIRGEMTRLARYGIMQILTGKERGENRSFQRNLFSRVEKKTMGPAGQFSSW